MLISSGKSSVLGNWNIKILLNLGKLYQPILNCLWSSTILIAISIKSILELRKAIVPSLKIKLDLSSSKLLPGYPISIKMAFFIETLSPKIFYAIIMMSRSAILAQQEKLDQGHPILITFLQDGIGLLNFCLEVSIIRQLIYSLQLVQWSNST